MRNKVAEKDRPLEESLTLLKNMFQKMGFHLIEEKIQNTAGTLWSILLKDSTSGLYSNGKGNSKLAARVSAYAEFAERLFSGYFFADFPAASDEYIYSIYETTVMRDEFHNSKILSEELWSFYNPDDELSIDDLVDFSSPDSNTIHLLPLKDRDGKNILFPTALLKELYASNGLSLGNSACEARVQALCEIYERYVRFEVISKGYALPDIPRELLSEFTNHVVCEFHEKGFSLLIKDASLGGSYPVVCAALIELASGRSLLSFGSHPDMEIATSRTLTELVQGRELPNLNDMVLPSIDGEEAALHSNLESHFINGAGLIPLNFFNKESDFDFHNWSVSSANTTRTEEWAHLLTYLNDKQIYIREQEIEDFTVCRLVVPGLSEIYPVEDLSYNSRKERRELCRLLTEQNTTLTEWEALPFQTYERVDQLCNVPFSGFWEGITFGEILILKALETGGKEKALELFPLLEHDIEESKQHSIFFFLLHALVQGVSIGCLWELIPVSLITSAEKLVFNQQWPQELLPIPGEHFFDVPNIQKLRLAKKKAEYLLQENR